MDTLASTVDLNASDKLSGNVNDKDDILQVGNSNANIEELNKSDKSLENVVEKSPNIPTTGAEDEDAVLGEDEAAKDYDASIDEDELLKDTEGDECRKDADDNELTTNDETSVGLQNEGTGLDTNQNIRNAPNSETERENEMHTDNRSLEESSSVDNKTDGSSNVGPSETENKVESVILGELEHREVGADIESTTSDSVKPNEMEGKVSSDTSISNKSGDKINTETVASSTENTEPKDSSNIRSDEVENTEVDPVDVGRISPTETDNAVNVNEDEVGANSIRNDGVQNSSSSNCDEKSENTEVSNKESAEKLAPDTDENSESRKVIGDKEGQNEKNEEGCGTKFLHVDQENSRPEESFEPMEVSGEDPFAQTSDVAMDTSEPPEKDGEQGKSQPDQSNNDVMDVVENTLNQTNEGTIPTEIQPDNSSETIDGNFKELEESSSSINNNNKISDSQSLNAEEATTSQKENDGDSDKNNVIELDDTNSKPDDDSLVPEIVMNESQEPDQRTDFSETVSVSQKPKAGKTSIKQRNKSKKSSTEESSEESDFEINVKSSATPRPKRNAAKKAESQIRVLTAEEEAVDQEDAASNDSKTNYNDIQSIDPDDSDFQTCYTCAKVGPCKVNVLTYGKTNYFCDDTCFVTFRDGPIARLNEATEIVPPSTVIKEIKSADIQPIDRAEFIRKCSQCSTVISGDDEKTLSWETMDFCSEECLGKYQQELGSHCANCKGNVQPASLGKYCVRFGYEVKQFCCSSCLEEFKKGLKVCSFCQKDISSGAEGFLAPVGDKGTFKDFCTQTCMEKYEQMSSNQPPPPQTHPCDVCNTTKLVEVEVFFDSKVNKLCSDICFTAYKFANKLSVDRCDMCHKYFDKEANGEKFNIFYDNIPHNFCSKTCMNVYILAKRKIVPCNWCKVKKYNFDMIKRVLSTGQVLMMCSLNCLTLYQVSVNAVSSRRIKCDMCMSVAQAQYHLTMSDATIRNFCTYPCVMNFQQQYSKSPITLPGGDAPPIPTGAPKRAVQKGDVPGCPVPVISSVTSLANGQPVVNNTATTLSSKASGKNVLVTRLQEPPVCRNKNTQTRPIMNTKSVSCRPHSTSVPVQTDENLGRPVLIPIPVPIYVPCPMAMYSFPFPVPVPFPLPVPVPVFLPTTRNSIKGIIKEIKRIQEKVPADPFEAELLMMAEMVAGDKKEVATSSDSEPDNEPPSSDTRPNSDGEGEFTPEAMESSNTFGDDIMQMALTMATELDEPPSEDLETQLTPATILNQQSENSEGNTGDTTKSTSVETRGRKRTSARNAQRRSGSSDTKRRKASINSESNSLTNPPPVIEDTKLDVNMKLKYTFGVNAWRSWVTQKNAEIEKLSTTNKKIKPFKTDILQLTADELNFSLCLFVKEVKKPNGSSYAPDTIYYLCLGIQQYLFENGRIDNIFTDSYFESFTNVLDEVARKFSELFNDHHYIVTRVEEEHLWESKQLGAHSPHVLLSTLMFFNTKHFNLTNVDEHMLLSFSHIMKHWKRNPNQQAGSGSSGRAPGSRNVLLRFYPPQTVLDDPNSKKKKMYEQHENEENPLRCPVKLYEFYMSKCPESVRNRNDVFYLQPERSCVPDSPVWYSTMALSREPLEKMLNRVKMVKEINIALLMP